MSDLTDLVAAIEGAAWQWWTASPDLVPLEFSYPYLAREGSAGAIPNPISSVALAFGKPNEFVFLTRSDARDVPPDWPQQMAEDRLDFDLFPTALSFELFALNDRDRQSRVLGIPHRESCRFNDRLTRLAVTTFTWRFGPARSVPGSPQKQFSYVLMRG